MGPGGTSDASLLASGKAGDFGVFYDRHVGAVTAYVGRRATGPELIFDFVAETFARALEGRMQYDPARGPAVGWLIGIARNLMMDAGRRGQVEASARVRLGMAPVELEDEQLELIAGRGAVDLRTALRSLPAEQRDGIVRRIVLDEDYSTIASDLRCSEQVVRKRVSRGLAALRESLGGER